MTNSIYFDHNATTPLLPQVIDVVSDSLYLCGNASSVHRFGRKARRLIEEAREKIAKVMSVKPAQIIFTSGGTEANNLAIQGVGAEKAIVSAIEHVSVLDAKRNSIVVPVDSNGIVDLRILEEKLIKCARPVIVSIMLANNETGVIQPVKQVAKLVHEHGAIIHCDAVQGVGKVSINFNELDVDLLSFSGHKIGAPQGIGALVLKEGLTITSVNKGGGQERKVRSGTENLSGIIGLGVATWIANENLTKYSHFSKLRDSLEVGIKKIAPVEIFGYGVERLPNTSCFSVPSLGAELQLMRLDLEGIAVSAGAACSSGKVSTSHVLLAMGVKPSAAETAIRVSFGEGNEKKHVEKFLSVWSEIYNSVIEPERLKFAAIR